MSPTSTFTRLAECLLLGVCVAATSIGVITAGPALAAAARVVREWEAGREPPLFATFLAAVRAETGRLLAPQLALLAVLTIGWLDLAVAGSDLPGGSGVRVVVAVAMTFAVASFLLMFPLQAARGGTWWSSWARSMAGCLRRPWLPSAVAAVLGVAVLLVAAAPPTFLVIGGPVSLSTGVLFSRADGGWRE